MRYNLALFLVLPQALVYLLYFLASAKTIYFNGAEKKWCQILENYLVSFYIYSFKTEVLTDCQKVIMNVGQL